MRNRTLVGSIILAAAAAVPSAQTGTDFSGDWALWQVTPRSATVAERLQVQQPVTTTNVRGQAMPPAYLTLTVERHFADHVQTDSHYIGVVGGVVGGTAGGPPASQVRWFIRWVGDALAISTTRLGASGDVALTSTELWRLDPDGRLRIIIETWQPDRTDAQTAVYRRISSR
jgi:hypothetical protein